MAENSMSAEPGDESPEQNAANPIPVVRQISWPMAAAQVAALGALMLAGWLVVGSENGVVAGAFLYLLYSFGSRAVLLRRFRRGMRLLAMGRYQDAIQAFEDSEAFLARHAWIDRYRALTLMSPSKAGYHEMSLNNIAVSHLMLGNVATAKEYYERALREHPDSAMAKHALITIRGIEDSTLNSEE